MIEKGMEKICSVVDEVISNFILTVSDKFEIEEESLRELWSEYSNQSQTQNTKKPSQVKTTKAVEKTVVTNQASQQKVQEKSETPEFSPDMNASDLLKYKKDDLVFLCRKHGKRAVGTKIQLVEHLLNITLSETSLNNEETKEKPKPVKSSEVQKSPGPKSKTSTPQIVDSVKKLISETVRIRKNAHGHYIDPRTNLIFNGDKNNPKIIGKQIDDKGTIQDLTQEDIELCKQYKYSYVLPDNLDKHINLKKIGVKELEEDDDEVSEEDIIEEVDDAEEIDEKKEDGDESFDEEELLDEDGGEDILDDDDDDDERDDFE